MESQKLRRVTTVALLQILAPTLLHRLLTRKMQNQLMVGNPVGKLQELTQKHGWPPPVYKFIPEQEHVMEFICQVRLGKQAKKGVGKSKTSAKRDAANAMLLALNEGTAIHQVAAEKYPGQSHEENVPIMRDGGKRVPAFTPQASHKGNGTSARYGWNRK